MPRTAIWQSDDGDEDGDTVDCPECGAEVYVIADRCPKCGYWFIDGDRETMKAERKVSAELQIVKLGAVFLVVVFAVAAVFAVVVN